MSGLKSSLQSFFQLVTGAPGGFSLEARIFNGICFFSMSGVAVGVIANFILGKLLLAFIMLPLEGCAITSYYFSRVRHKLNPAVILYMAALNVLVIAGFVSNSGINGPSLLIFVVSLFITISVVPRKDYWFWILLNLAIVAGLMITGYRYPALIHNTYSNLASGGRYIDLSIVYLLVSFLIFAVTNSIRRNYYQEKLLVNQKAAELEKANEMKDKLFSIVAHDLRAPLASIENYLEIITDFKLEEEELLSIKKDLLDTTRNTRQMLANLLLWSKSQMQGVVVNITDCDVKKTLTGIFEIYHTISAEKGIHLVDRLAKKIIIKADADMLQLIIRNLINNAIKFTDAGGRVVISGKLEGCEYVIMVTDSGRGIPFEQQEDIFSLRTNSAAGTRNEKGAGLGLVLCKEYAELQGSRIAFESAPGAGTTFYLYCKLAEGAAGETLPGKGGEFPVSEPGDQTPGHFTISRANSLKND